MKFRALICLGLLNVMALPAFSNDSPPAETPEQLASQVRATEIVFAKTLANRDAKTFTSMIAPDAIWIADATLRGPAEVMTRWRKYFDAPQAPFSWAPEIVEVQAGGKLALSTGPVNDASGKRVGTYTSIWRRERTGEWKLIFDRGCPGCDCDKK